MAKKHKKHQNHKNFSSVNPPVTNNDIEKQTVNFIPSTPTNEQEVAEFMNKVKDLEKGHQLDLSSDEDLSIAVMNLISIEEHLFFTAQKTQDEGYYDVLYEVREMRKSLMKMLIQDYEGEVWCTSKHLLSASMRCMEVGTKFLTKGDRQQAEEFFSRSYDLYNLFWGLNLKLVQKQELSQLPAEEKAEIDAMSAQAGETFSATLPSEIEEEVLEEETWIEEEPTDTTQTEFTETEYTTEPIDDYLDESELDDEKDSQLENYPELETVSSTRLTTSQAEKQSIDQLAFSLAELDVLVPQEETDDDLTEVNNAFLESLTITDEEEAALTDNDRQSKVSTQTVTAPSRLPQNSAVSSAPIINATKKPSLFAKLGQVVGNALNCCRE